MFEWMISLNHHRGTAILRAIEMSREADNKTDLAPSSRILQSLTFKPADQTAGTCQVSILSRRDSTSSNLSDIREHTASDLPSPRYLIPSSIRLRIFGISPLIDSVSIPSSVETSPICFLNVSANGLQPVIRSDVRSAVRTLVPRDVPLS